MRVTGVLAAVTSALVLIACAEEAPIETTGVDIDLTPCLGALDMVPVGDRDSGLQPVVSTCRDNLDVAIAPTPVNACFIVRESTDGVAAQRLPLHWTGGRLTNPFPDQPLDFAPGRSLESAIFFLAMGDESGDVCDGFEIGTACTGDANCVLKLFEAGIPSDALSFDFTNDDGTCNAESGGGFGDAGVERCDGMDNDCDRRIDEEIPGVGDACEVGVGACRDTGERVCDVASGMVVCDAVEGEPREEHRPRDLDDNCDTDDETCCDGVDDDCDGETDEDIACTPCADDAACAENVAGQQCVGGFCQTCDPADHAGCADTELCCRSGDGPRCEITGSGPSVDEQCTACGTPCVIIIPVEDGPDRRVQNADACGERSCMCGFGPACTEAAPFCEQGQCRECLNNGDCGPQQLCCDGTCQNTDPETACTGCGEPCDPDISNRCADRECLCGDDQCVGEEAACIPGACTDPELTLDDPACEPAPRAFRCAECNGDVDCVVPRAACVDQQCEECRNDDDLFCENAGFDDRPQCVVSTCFECDPRNDEHAGCIEDSGQPICDDGDNTCRPCEADAECDLRPGDRNQCVGGRCVACDPETYIGCADPAVPVCDADDLACRQCRNNGDCEPLSSGGVEKVCANGRCQGCDVDTNEGCNSVGPVPICHEVGGDRECRGCIDHSECPSVEPGELDGDRDGPDGPIVPASESIYCVVGQCRECVPDDHEGCPEDSDRPICRSGDCAVCTLDVDCAARPGLANQCIAAGPEAGRCKQCDPVDNAGCGNPLLPICNPRTFECQACADDDECNRGREDGLAPLECVEPRCAECDPRPGELNSGCDPLLEVPICDDGNFCRGCRTPAECVALDAVRGLDVDLFGCVEGGCTECHPETQDGCPETEICDPGGSCRLCTVSADDPLNAEGDAQCAEGEGVQTLTQCVAGECSVCDPIDFAGCDAFGPAPVCELNGGDVRCRACESDDECGNSPVGNECVDGFCRACDPSDGARNAGCDPAGIAPWCDPALFSCSSCSTGVAGEDARCQNNPNPVLRQCVDDRCAECDPNNHDGCAEDAAEPICGAGRTCGLCQADAQCELRPGNNEQCVDGRCVVCDPADDAGCNNPNRPICDDRERTCRECVVDDECRTAEAPDLLCVGGRCVECDPGTNNGCDVASGQPYCDPGNAQCRACTVLPGDGAEGDAECVSGDRPYCVDERCFACDRNNHDGCRESSRTPICGNDGTCGACQSDAQCDIRPGDRQYCDGDTGRCVQCNQDSECPGDAPVCDGHICRPCADSGECIDECVDGTCTGCNTDNNTGCNPTSASPICGAGNVCRGCADDGECQADGDLQDQCFNERCVECDPGEQVGCNVGGARPFCASNGSCQPCAEDAQCELAPGARDQCVDTRCELCDPTGNVGCDPASDTPICADGGGGIRCRGCSNDDQCAGNPNGEQCVDGACAECDPDDVNTCNRLGPLPVCDADDQTCRTCEDDRECAGNGQRTRCVGGTCEACDPADGRGCREDGATPICDPTTFTCSGCRNNAECILRTDEALPVCVAERCLVCNPANNVGCGGDTPICADRDGDGSVECSPCEGNNECGPGVQCVDGACAGCNPDGNAGCTTEDPICDRQSRECRPCRNDDECGAEFCFSGQCEACDPEGHAGCPDSQLCCQRGGLYTCTPTGLGDGSQCEACGEACGDDGTNACENRLCRCGGRAECGADRPFCLGDAPDGVCSECESNADCEALSDAPICGFDTNTCRDCAGDDECIGHERGEQCVASGACHQCDPAAGANDAGCDPASRSPICDDGNFRCRRCNNDGECRANGLNGPECVRQRCEACDPGDASTCDADSPTPVCVDGPDGIACGCADDDDCRGNDAGEQCVEGVCAECDPDGGLATGCNLTGNRPYCNDDRTCVSCQEGSCAGNPNGLICVGDACRECVVGTNEGCEVDELCCDPEGDGTPRCITNDEDACVDCDTGCADRGAPICEDRDCVCEGGAPCAAGEVCVGGVCEECELDDDCDGASVCVDNACVECRVGETNDGCPEARPICGDDNTCGRCAPGAAGDAQCAADPDLDDYCVGAANAVCAACDTETHAGCEADELCCSVDGTIQCVQTTNDLCTNCDEFGGACLAGESCAGRECVAD